MALSRCFPALLLTVLLAELKPVQAGMSFREIPGRYSLAQGNLEYCTANASIARAGSTLEATSVSFNGVACTLGSFTLSEKNGLADWSSAHKAAVGVLVTRTPGTDTGIMSCGNYIISNVNLLFMRPVQDVPFFEPGYVNPFLYRKGVRYWVIWDAKGSCVYVQRAMAAASLPAAPPPLPPVAEPAVQEPQGGQGTTAASGTAPGAGEGQGGGGAASPAFGCGSAPFSAPRRPSRRRSSPCSSAPDGKAKARRAPRRPPATRSDGSWPTPG